MTSESPPVHVERSDLVAVVELRRAPNNFIDLGMLDLIVREIEALATSDCRAIVLASDGKHFCAGADLTRRASRSDVTLPELVLRLARQPLPVVALVQGAAVGAGLGLAMLADLRLASESASFAANFARLGFHPGWGLSSTLPLAVGHAAALDLLLTARRVDVGEAQRLGIVHEVVDSSSLRSRGMDLASQIAESAPLAVRSIRATLRAPLLATIEQVLDRETSEQEKQLKSEDAREGIHAASERRTPRFRGV